MEMVAIDMIGPLPLSKSGNKYILTVIDYLTRLCVAVPMADASSETFVRSFIHYFVCVHGVPRRLLSDRGSNFTSDISQAVFAQLGIDHVMAVPGHAQTNGLDEHVNGYLQDLLRAVVEGSRDD
jgi:transposase InsO family protein